MSFLVIIAVVVGVMCVTVWFLFCHGLDRIIHPEEWEDAGCSGERMMVLREDLEVGLANTKLTIL